MRRLLAALLVLPALAVPAGAEAPRRPAVLHEPGRVTLAPVTGAARLDSQLEAAATGPLARKVLRAYDVAVAQAASSIPTFRIREVFTLSDLDGDRVGDLLYYDSRVTISRGVPKGNVTLSVYSGRTGARRWRKTLTGMAIAYPFEAKVGSGKAGLLVVRPYNIDDAFGAAAYRVMALGGARGERVYDHTLSPKDGLGDVRWGGLLNAIPGGGTEVLIGRVRTQGDADLRLTRAETSQATVIDGKDGKVRTIGAATPGASSMSVFLATGDLNSDGRDDFVGVRRVAADVGTITAFGSADGLPLWTSPPLAIGYAVRVNGIADMAGDKRKDVLIESWLSEYGPLEIHDVVDGVPLVDRSEVVHGFLFDAAGLLQWDRADGPATYLPLGDIDKDGKVDVVSVAVVMGEKDGLRFTAVTGSGKVLYTRDATVPAPRGREFVATDLAYVGDLDADNVEDLAFLVYSVSRVEYRFDFGYFLAGRNQVSREYGGALRGTLDGRGDEFITGSSRGTGYGYTMRNGIGGPASWTVTVPRPVAMDIYDIGPIRGARGKCDGVLLLGEGPESHWMAGLDGATGRVRWVRAIDGRAPRASAFRRSGGTARCR